VLSGPLQTDNYIRALHTDAEPIGPADGSGE
jgi:hypothetical protein